MKLLGEQLGYCPNVKEYKKNPDGYKGSITDICTTVRVAVTGKKNSPGLIYNYECNRQRQNGGKAEPLFGRGTVEEEIA